MSSSHGDEDLAHQCKSCGKTVYGNTELRKHMGTHHDARRFACANCPETFASQSNLRGHKEEEHQIVDMDIPEKSSPIKPSDKRKVAL